MWESVLSSFYDELEKIGAAPELVISAPKKRKEHEPARERVLRRLKGFAAGALPTAAGVRYLVPRAESVRPELVEAIRGAKIVRGLHPATHTKLQTVAGLGAGVLGAALAGKDSKSSRVIVQL